MRQDGGWRLLPSGRDKKPLGPSEIARLHRLASGFEDAAATLVLLAGEVESGRLSALSDCRERIAAADTELVRVMTDGEPLPLDTNEGSFGFVQHP